MRLLCYTIALLLLPIMFSAQDPTGHWQSTFNAPGIVADIYSVASEGGDVAAIGEFRTDDGRVRGERIAVWQERSWTVLPDPPGGLYLDELHYRYPAIALVNGTVFVRTGEGLYTFDGDRWTPVPGVAPRNGEDDGIVALDGTLYRLPRLERWNGSSWDSTLTACAAQGEIDHVAISHEGNALLAGRFAECFGHDQTVIVSVQNGVIDTLPALPGWTDKADAISVAFNDTVPVAFQVEPHPTTNGHVIVPYVLENETWVARSVGIDEDDLDANGVNRPRLMSVGGHQLYVGLPGWPPNSVTEEPEASAIPCHTTLYRLDVDGGNARWTAQTGELRPVVRTIARWNDSGVTVAGNFSRGIDNQLERSIVRLRDSVVDRFQQPAERYNGLDGEDMVDMVAEDDSIWVVGTNLHTDGGEDGASVMVWNGTSWRAIDSGVQGSVSDVARIDGQLYIGGALTIDAEETSVARLDGSVWRPIGEVGLNVRELKARDGALYVGGNRMVDVGNERMEPRGRIVKWDGTDWTETLSQWEYVLTNFEPANDTVYITGHDLGKNPEPGILFMRLVDGSVEVLDGLSGTKTNASFPLFGASPSVSVMTYRDGWLYVGGRFDSAGGRLLNDVGRFNGSEWFPLGEGVGRQSSYRSYACHIGLEVVVDIDFVDNHVIVVGKFDRPGKPFPPGRAIDAPGSIALFDLTTTEWSQNTEIDGLASRYVRHVEVHDGRVTIAGRFDFVDGVRSHNIATTDQVVSVPTERTPDVAPPELGLAVENGAIVVHAQRALTGSVTMYSPSGQQVARLFEGELSAGESRYTIPGELASGIYLVQATDGTRRSVSQTALVR